MSASSSAAPEQKTNIAQVKEGDRFSLIRYCRVTEVRGDKFTVATDDGSFWQVDKNIVQRSCYTANQYTSEQKLNKTDLATKFERSGDTIFTVCFRKKVKREDVAEKIATLPEDPRAWNQTKRRKLADDLLRGDERIMVGFLIRPEPDAFGRLKVHDLEVTEGTAERLVDPRTIEWLVIRNVKYTVK